MADSTGRGGAVGCAQPVEIVGGSLGDIQIGDVTVNAGVSIGGAQCVTNPTTGEILGFLYIEVQGDGSSPIIKFVSAEDAGVPADYNLCGVDSAATNCNPYIGSFNATALPATIEPYNTFVVTNKGCADAVVTTSAGTVTVGAKSVYSSSVFECNLTALSVAGSELDKVTVVLQRTK